MYRFYIENIKNDYHYEALARVFLSDEEFETIPIKLKNIKDIQFTDNSFLVNKSNSNNNDEIMREFYVLLSNLTGKTSKYGILTGVRPLNNAFSIYNQRKDLEHVLTELQNKYLISEERSKLLVSIIRYQTKHVKQPDPKMISLYVGIPFCPTICNYCAFSSFVVGVDTIDEYLKLLHKEIKYAAQIASRNGNTIESVYIGGGTPTTLSAKQLSSLIDCISNEFNIDLSKIEFTVEAGRPDTITEEKLRAIKDGGVRRISINPQSMKEETLKIIGRNHSPQDIVDAFNNAQSVGFDVVNSDLIAGLQGENIHDFKNSLDSIIKLGANNITIHTLSIKNGSRLKDENPEYYKDKAYIVDEMLDCSREVLFNKGFEPYYLYRQKHQLGASENTGFCKNSTHSIYNIRIMEENQTIMALGAGAIGKTVNLNRNPKLKRIPNMSNYNDYIDRFDEVIKRKDLYLGGSDGN